MKTWNDIIILHDFIILDNNDIYYRLLPNPRSLGYGSGTDLCEQNPIWLQRVECINFNEDAYLAFNVLSHPRQG